jgi:hypothetical protein
VEAIRKGGVKCDVRAQEPRSAPIKGVVKTLNIKYQIHLEQREGANQREINIPRGRLLSVEIGSFADHNIC